jgi:hypothetical protein
MPHIAYTTAGTGNTAGFVENRVNYGSGITRTRRGYGFGGYGCGVGKTYPRYTRIKP